MRQLKKFAALTATALTGLSAAFKYAIIANASTSLEKLLPPGRQMKSTAPNVNLRESPSRL